MANEATVQTRLRIKNGNLDYQSQPGSFTADVAGAKGPTPGAITVSTDGTDIDLGELDTPGLCRVLNLDDTNFVEFGRWDNTTEVFYPLIKVLPGEGYVFRLSSMIEEEYAGTGTGTTANVSTFRAKADTAACNVLVEAFEE